SNQEDCGRGDQGPIATTKSPIISPDLESGTPPDSRQRIVREQAKKTRLFALLSKPGLRPESPDSPRIRARQKIPLSKSGVRFKRLASHERLPQNTLYTSMVEFLLIPVA